MTFLHRGRPVFGRIGRPSEPAPEPVAQATGPPVAAPAPAGVTDDLRAAIASLLCQVWPTDIYLNAEGNANKIRGIADIVMDVVRPELEQLLAQLPPDGQGRWRQGTKNPRNLYVHQGDDETGQPVGQLYSAELAALVCDAVNAQQARGEA